MIGLNGSGDILTSNYEDADTYVDLPPVLSEVLKEGVDIDRDYFVTMPDDLSPEQAEEAIKEIRRLCSTVDKA